MNRTLKAATVTRDYDEKQPPRTEHLANVLHADTRAKRLKMLPGLTPDESIIQGWQQEPERVLVNPCHHTLGLNI